MATSGTIQQAIRTGYRIQIAWTVDSQSVANNTSTVTAKVQLVSTGSSYTINSTASKSGSLTINGTTYTFSFTASLSGSQTKTLYTKTVTVAHSTDGSKTCSFSATCGINVTLSGTYYGSITASGTGTFDTIARASTISGVTSSVAINGTNAVTVNITRASSSFTHTVVFSFGSYSNTITGVGTSTSYAIPTTWINAIPSATSGTAKVTVTTYSGSTKIGSAVSKNFTVTVPSTVVPAISTLTLSEAVSAVATQFGVYVQNKSKITAKTTASGVYSSTIKTYKTTIQGVNYSGATVTSGVLTKSGTSTVTVTVTDSRGRTASKTASITVIAYTAPKITSFQGFRCLADGTENYEGTYIKAAFNFSISSVSEKNTASYTIEYKLSTASTWTALTSGSVYALNSSIISASGAFSVDSSYDIRLTVKDYFATITSTFEIPTAFTLLDFNASGKGLAFGKVSEEDTFECALAADFMNNIRMGGWRKDNSEKNIYFQSGADATYDHNCKVYGGNGESATSIGMHDTNKSHGIFRYLSSTEQLIIDGSVKLMQLGNEFAAIKQFTYGDRNGVVHFANGLLIQWGVETITPVANVATGKTVTFPIAYDVNPMVLANTISTVPGTTVVGGSSASITTTTVGLYITRVNATNTSIGWIAIGHKA